MSPFAKLFHYYLDLRATGEAILTNHSMEYFQYLDYQYTAGSCDQELNVDNTQSVHVFWLCTVLWFYVIDHIFCYEYLSTYHINNIKVIYDFYDL